MTGDQKQYNLYIVATPIGNLKDMSNRALEILQGVDSVICEDTRKTGNLLYHFGIKKPLIIYNDYNEDLKLAEIITRLEKGEKMALVSDSGTPLISDPGYVLVREALKRELKITVIPGPSAAITALVLSGLPADSFLFLGFLPKSSGKRKNYLQKLHESLVFMQHNSISPTVIMYESPHRLKDVLSDMKDIFGDIESVIVKELTKIFESVKKERLSIHMAEFSETPPKGEFVILFSLRSKRGINTQ